MPIADLFGNQRLKKILLSYLKNETLPFSMIFSGPSSARPKEFALAFARAVNCPEATADCCDRCENCRDIGRDLFPDVRVLNPAGQYYKKEQIAALIEDSYKKPLRGQRRVTIMNEAHLMMESAANAFLKVLEEPAPANVFILITDNLHALLPTIKSRCQILNFTPPSRSEIMEDARNRGLSEEDAVLLGHVSQGNVIAAGEGMKSPRLKWRETAFDVIEKLLMNRDVEDVLLSLVQKGRSRESFIHYFRNLIHLISLCLRDIMVLKIDQTSSVLINVDKREQLMKLGERVSMVKLLYLIRRTEELQRDVQRNLNSKVLILEFIRDYARGR